MQRTVKILGVVAAACALSACAIHQQVRPAAVADAREVCLIDNPKVREGFKTSATRALTAQGYSVRELPAAASLQSCNVTITYTANWRWDLAMYMAYAELRVYLDGRPNGEAIYDSTRGGGNMGKFIDADKKITELVTQLMPRR